MIQPIKVGLLAPYSSIYPTITPNIVNGFYSAMPAEQQNQFQFIPEYIKQGGATHVKEAIQKLVQFNNVDILSGLISYNIVPELVPFIETRNKLAFFFDVGEYIPYTHHISDHVFFNSFQLWQSEYALGHWAQKEYGDKGAIIMPLYDAGYHLHSAFRQGTISAGSQLIDYHILPYSPDKSQVTGQIEHFFNLFKKDPPSYLHALFCGTEAVEFLVEFKNSGLSEKIPLIISAHMASEEILEYVKHLNIKCVSASMWNYNLKTDRNNKFKQDYHRQTGLKADFFALLGYEAGLLFQQLIPDIQKRDWKEAAKKIKTGTIRSPRGERTFFLDSDYSTPIIDIEKIETNSLNISKFVIAQGNALKYNHETYNEIHKENVTGWQNPYLCV